MSLWPDFCKLCASYSRSCIIAFVCASHVHRERAAPDTHFNTQQRFQAHYFVIFCLFQCEVTRNTCEHWHRRQRVKTETLLRRERNIIVKKKKTEANKCESSGDFLTFPDAIWGSEGKMEQTNIMKLHFSSINWLSKLSHRLCPCLDQLQIKSIHKASRVESFNINKQIVRNGNKRFLQSKSTVSAFEFSHLWWWQITALHKCTSLAYVWMAALMIFYDGQKGTKRCAKICIVFEALWMKLEILVLEAVLDSTNINACLIDLWLVKS